MNTTAIINEKKKRAALIRYWMKLLDLTGAEIGRRAGNKSRTAVNLEVQGAHRSRFLRERIAAELGKSYKEVWGDE